MDSKGLEQIDLGQKHNQAQSPKYAFISKLKESKLMQQLIGLMPEGLKDKIKKSTYQDGYSKDLVLDEKARDFLTQFYQEDLVLLKRKWGISFD